jgi:hypothetical protein
VVKSPSTHSRRRGPILGRGLAFGAIVLALAAGACGNAPGHDAPATDVVSFDTVAHAAIDGKWDKLGGAAVVGTPTADVKSLPPGADGQYQTFTKGVIVYSNDYGAVLITQAELDAWLARQSVPGPGGAGNLYAYLGLPTKDFTTTGATSTATFERGALVTDTAANATRAVHGVIYERYLNFSSKVGIPLEDEVAAAGGGRKQRFANGAIYWKEGLGAFIVANAIVGRFDALGGSGSGVGFPISDTGVVTDASGIPVGQSQKFENGNIYSSAATGTWEVTGAIAADYEARYGGPIGWLGFPISGERTASSGDHFNDFKGGMLVDHRAADVWKGVVPFNSLVFHLNRVQSGGGEGACGGVDIYTFIHVNTPAGEVVNQRWPGSGDVGGGADANLPFDLGVANSATTVTASIDVWDSDGGFCLGDDHLGTATDTYSVDNLWGLNSAHNHHSCDDGCADSDFNLDRGVLPFDTSDFRGQQWWSFHNFDTHDLSYDQFAATFADVDPDESGWLHPFNFLYFKLAYKSVARNGNCFGMALESIYAAEARAPYAEPIHGYFPETQDGRRLTDATPGPARDALINEINIKHGYQLGLDNVIWTLAMFAAGLTHDPLVNYNLLNSPVPGIPAPVNTPLIMLTKDELFSGAHTVRPYQWEHHGMADCEFTTGSAGCWWIHIADPNFPTGISNADDHIEIGADDSYHYRDFSGGVFSGGRLMVMPYRNFNHTPITPLSDPISVIEDLTMFIMGSSGTTSQITDAAGRTMFEPGLSGPPTRWDQIRHDAGSRIPDLAPMVLDEGPGSHLAQVVVGRGRGQTHIYEMVPLPDSAPGTVYEATYSSAKLSTSLQVPGTPGKPDKLTAEAIGGAARAVSFAVPAGSTSKQVTWTVAGVESQRWAELSALTMAPGQQIRLHLDGGGFKLVIDNTGPETTAILRVKAGPGANPVVVGPLTIKPGDSSVEYQLPVTTVTLSDQVPGKLGWLKAPVTITLSAQDFSGTGIDVIETSRDQTTWVTYTGPFTYSDEGDTILYYRARDKAKNRELAKSIELKIDTHAPVVTVTADQATYTRLQPFVVHFSASDAVPGSGVSSVTGLLDGTSVSNAESVDLLWYALGTHTLSVTAEDVAGWTTSGSASFQIIATRASLGDLIRKLRDLGEIDSDGITNSLLTKVEHNLGALLHELDAQSGKHVTTRAAALIKGDAEYVIAHP